MTTDNVLNVQNQSIVTNFYIFFISYKKKEMWMKLLITILIIVERIIELKNRIYNCFLIN